MKMSIQLTRKLKYIGMSSLLILLSQGEIIGEALAGSSLIDLKQTGRINRARIFQEGSDNFIVGSRSDGTIDNSIPAQQLNLIGGTLSFIKQQQGGNQLGLFQKSESLSDTILNIEQRNGNNTLGIYVDVQNGGENNLSVTQNGNRTLTIKQHVTSGDYRVTLEQP